MRLRCWFLAWWLELVVWWCLGLIVGFDCDLTVRLGWLVVRFGVDFVVCCFYVGYLLGCFVVVCWIVDSVLL